MTKEEAERILKDFLWNMYDNDIDAMNLTDDAEVARDIVGKEKWLEIRTNVAEQYAERLKNNDND